MTWAATPSLPRPVEGCLAIILPETIRVCTTLSCLLFLADIDDRCRTLRSIACPSSGTKHTLHTLAAGATEVDGDTIERFEAVKRLGESVACGLTTERDKDLLAWELPKSTVLLSYCHCHAACCFSCYFWCPFSCIYLALSVAIFVIIFIATFTAVAITVASY